jgi:hypothetical protein
VSNRDEFAPKTKRALALGAGYTCSFRGCHRPTSGPSEEAPDAVSMTGKAAHIHAAAPGGPRYLAAMTCDRQHRQGDRKGKSVEELIAVGPGIVFCGELIGADHRVWNFSLQNFVDGDLHAFLTFIARYDTVPPMDRYVLVNSLGDGRVMNGAPALKKWQDGHYEISFPVAQGAERIRAADLPTDLALSDAHDLFVAEDGNIAVVSGVDSLPQKIKMCLSSQKGESPFHRDFGTRIAEYYRLLGGSPWFEQYLKLEVIRQAAIPYIDPLDSRHYTPLLCVERVFGIKPLADAPTKNWLPVRVDLEVKGLGRWQHELSICLPKDEVQHPAWDELTPGPLLQGGR